MHRKEISEARRLMKERIGNIFRGVLIGCANIIPGVSGGTVAVSMGVFDTIILSVNGLIGDRGNRKRHFFTLLPILLGVLIGLVLFSKLISFLFDYAPLPTFAAFLGMVLGSLPMLAKNSLKEGFRPISLVWFIAAAGLVLLMEFSQGGLTVSEPYTFLSAILLMLSMMFASASMVMPGLSGSFVMLLLGWYEIAVGALANLEWLKLLPMIAGALLGVVLVSKLMASLLKNHYASTYAAIMGFVCGSVVVMVRRTISYLPVSAWRIVFAVVMLIAGVLLTILSQRGEGRTVAS
jgi:putative membrane protein